MSERYRGEQPSFEAWRVRQHETSTENTVLQEGIKELDRLLAILIEISREWDSYSRLQLRNQITQLLAQLGVQGLGDYQGLVELYRRAYGPLANFMTNEEWKSQMQKLDEK